LRIIPVIDILDGIVVHAVKGQRSKYQPLKSQICNSTDPLKVALAFREFDFKSLYIADLNAIMRKGNNSAAIKEIATRTGLELMVDSGTNRLQQIQELIDNKISKVIIGTETLLTINFVKEAISSFGTDKLVLSLDLKNGKVLGKFENANSLDSIMLAKKLEELQVSEVIVLDLARVGSQEGVDFDLLKDMRENLKLKLLVGGGVRDMDDLLKLKNIAINGVLLATSLHAGLITIETLRSTGLL